MTALSGVEASAHTCSPRSRPEQAACCPNKSAELGCSPRTPSQKSDLKKNPNLLSRWYLFSVKWKRNFTSIFAVPYCHTAIRPRGPRRVAGGVRTVSGPARALALGGTARRGRERDGWGVCALARVRYGLRVRGDAVNDRRRACSRAGVPLSPLLRVRATYGAIVRVRCSAPFLEPFCHAGLLWRTSKQRHCTSSARRVTLCMRVLLKSASAPRGPAVKYLVVQLVAYAQRGVALCGCCLRSC